MTTRHAVALRAFNHADTAFAKNAVILDLDAGQFEDWKDADLVREATAAEVAKARGEKAPSKPKTPRKPKGAPPASAEPEQPVTPPAAE